MRKTLPTITVALALSAVACVPAPDSAEVASRVPAATVIGEPISCLNTSRIRDTQVHDDRTIDFTTIDGKVYRQTLPYPCSGLGFDERFSYRSTNGQLCSSDTITVLQSGGGVPGPTCGLDRFVPIRLEKAGE